MVSGRGVAGGGKLSILPRDRTQFKISISVQQWRRGLDGGKGGDAGREEIVNTGLLT